MGIGEQFEFEKTGRIEPESGPVDSIVSMKTATPQLDWSLFVECPECGEDFDLKDREEEAEFSKPIFNNTWDDIKGMTVDCPKCKSTFMLDKVEY